MGTITERTNATQFLPREIWLELTRTEGDWEISADYVFVGIYNATGGTVLPKVSIPLQLTTAQKATVLSVLQTRLTEFAQNQELTLLQE